MHTHARSACLQLTSHNYVYWLLVLIARAVFFLEQGHRHTHKVRDKTDDPIHALAAANVADSRKVDMKSSDRKQWSHEVFERRRWNDSSYSNDDVRPWLEVFSLVSTGVVEDTVR